MIWIIILFVIIYVASAISMWRYFHIAYSEGGIWEWISPNAGDLFYIFTPIVNSVCAFAFWADRHPRANNKRGKSLSKFFNIKK